MVELVAPPNNRVSLPQLLQFGNERTKIDCFRISKSRSSIMKQQQGGLQQPNKYVSELRLADVLFGRGSGPNDHEGNIRFRQYVAERKAQYMSTNHRLTKTKIAKEIVARVYEDQGRFVKRVEPNELREMGLPEDMDCYELVDEETILEKAKQALRQNTSKAARGDGDSIPPSAHDEATVSSHYPEITPVSRNCARATNATLQSIIPHHHRDALSIPMHSPPQQTQNPDDFEPIPIPMSAPPITMESFRTQPPPPAATSASQWGNYYPPLSVRSDPAVPPLDQAEAQLRHIQQLQQQQPPPSVYTHYDSYAARLPSHLVPPYPSTTTPEELSNYSMAQLPHEEVTFDQRRSMTVKDLELARDRVRSSFSQSLSLQQATQTSSSLMEEMMDSFTQIKMGGPEDAQRRMMASTETMGTIEPLGSVADMSLMGSSTFSLFRAGGNDSVAVMEDSLHPADLLQGAQRSQSNISSNGTSRNSKTTSSSDSSLHFSDNFFGEGSRRKSSSISTSINGLISDVRRQLDDEGLATLPRTIGVMVETPDEMVESMHESSLSAMKTAFASSPGDGEDRQEL